MKKLANLKGVKTLNKTEQKLINGGCVMIEMTEHQCHSAGGTFYGVHNDDYGYGYCQVCYG